MTFFCGSDVCVCFDRDVCTSFPNSHIVIGSETAGAIQNPFDSVADVSPGGIFRARKNHLTRKKDARIAIAVSMQICPRRANPSAETPVDLLGNTGALPSTILRYSGVQRDPRSRGHAAERNHKW